jgi:hypothetical protein
MVTKEALSTMMKFDDKGRLVWLVERGRAEIGSFVGPRSTIHGTKYKLEHLKEIMGEFVPPEPVVEELIVEVVPEPVVIEPEPEPVEPIPPVVTSIESGDAFLPDDIRRENGKFLVYVNDTYYGTYVDLHDAEIMAIKIRQRLRR